MKQQAISTNKPLLNNKQATKKTPWKERRKQQNKQRSDEQEHHTEAIKLHHIIPIDSSHDVNYYNKQLLSKSNLGSITI